MKHNIKKLLLELLPYIVVFMLSIVCVRQCSNNADIKDAAPTITQVLLLWHMEKDREHSF